MRFISIVLITVLASASSSARRAPVARQSGEAEEQIIKKVQMLPASELDSEQAAVPLEEWLTATLGSGSPVTWGISDCDLMGEYPEGHKMCVAARASRPGFIGLRLHILVGTFERGVFGPPSVTKQSFMWKHCLECSRDTAGRECTMGIESLTNLRENVKVLEAKPECK